jgi:glycosyl hydrolase family 106( putative alpha-L-rhamnosidase)
MREDPPGCDQIMAEQLVSRNGKVAILILLCACFVQVPRSSAQQDQNLALLEKSFVNPPDDCRIMMRWWWFGPAVTKPELQRELEQMKAEGIGGVEIATLYPLALDDPKTGFHNLQFLSEEHLVAIRFAAATARTLGLRVDITMGSGWPFGGPHIPVTQNAGELRVETISVPPGTDSVATPDIATGERLIATFLAPVRDGHVSLQDAKQKPLIVNGRLRISPPLEFENDAIFFLSSRTGMTVKRPAVGAEGFVLDHYDRNAIETHLHAVGDRFMEAFGEHPPYAVFSDSLEDYGSDWTGDLMEEFRVRRGYDLTPYLLALIGDAGPLTASVRHDWGRTLTELANERFLAPLHTWAQQHHTLFRSQTYGFPPVTLSSNQYADLPEGEGKAALLMWRQFSDLRWAASAGHLFGRPVISSETWTWLHSPAFRATPLDLKAEADLHFLQGINQLVGHGWPYSPPEAGEPGWRMYAAAALNAHNPWSFVMPDLALYLQRVSFVLRQGKPANDVALLLPNDDVWSTFSARSNSTNTVMNQGGFNTAGSNFSIDESLDHSLVNAVIPQVLDAGFNLDFIDADAIDTVGIPYAVLILPAIDRLPLATYRRIEEYARHGGIVIAAHSLPSTAPGLIDAESEGRQIREISQRLFSASDAAGHFIPDENQLGTALPTYLTPDVTFSPRAPRIGFIHRKLDIGDLFFIANTSNQPHHVQATFRHAAKHAQWLDPFTGGISAVENPAAVDIDLQPYESRLILFTDSATQHERKRPTPRVPSKTIDLTTVWSATFLETNQSVTVPKLRSWSEDALFKYYSGRVSYTRTFELSAGDLSSGITGVLDFGQGTPLEEPNPLPQFSMRAYFEGPIREAAEIYVNGERAGFVWHPPYTIDVRRFLTVGTNSLRIVVGNTAINQLAGRALPTYRLLNERYGERFVPQDMVNLQPLPSGVLGSLQLNLAKAP